MCSNNAEDDEIQTMIHKTKRNLIGSNCRKCSEPEVPATVVLRGKDTYCRDCFLASVSHKFRSALGKSKLMKPNDKVLIAFSGSQSSVALLHLIQSGLSETSHKKLLFEPFILYVDEGAVLGLSSDERKETIKEISKVLNLFSFPSYVTPLEMYVQSSENTKEPCSSIDSDISLADDSIIKEMFEKVTSLTSKEDLLYKLRNNLLVNAAKALGCNKIFTGETSNDIAIKLLSNLSLGRGAQLPFDVGFCDTRDAEVKVLRPLRDLSKKEVAFYNIFQSLDAILIPSLSTMAGSQSSIQKLTEEFVTDLQEGFPATVSTVFRTGDKLSAKQEQKSDEESCPLCNAPLDTADVASSSLSATTFSSVISTLGPEGFDSTTLTKFGQDLQCCGESNTEESSCQCSSKQVKRLSIEELRDIICYGCYLIFKEMDLKTLPSHITTLLVERTRSHNMRKEISDFLL